MRINPHLGVSHTSPAAVTKNKNGAVPGGSVSSQNIKGPTASSTNPIVSKEQIASLASKLKNGELTIDQACEEFTGAVADTYAEGQLQESVRKDISKEVSKFLSDDKAFLAALDKNLRGLLKE